MITCRKCYTDIPFAHRQHHHDGHCALIHGHNWGINITFGCNQTDANGFVVDFGKLKFIRRWIEENLDHGCVFNHDDPMLAALTAVGGDDVWKVYLVDSCSCEGLAEHLYAVFDAMVREATEGRAFVVAIEVTEDSRNSATYTG
jgi:6-pyruvoyltetrahydropterin/6-carboxytetrahydropterin synthase